MNNNLVSIVVLNEDGSDLPDHHRCLQIQSLFMRTQDQKRQFGQRLTHEAVQAALNHNLEILFVKAHEVTVSFFELFGFHPIPVTGEVHDYAYRSVRSVI